MHWYQVLYKSQLCHLEKENESWRAPSDRNELESKHKNWCEMYNKKKCNGIITIKNLSFSLCWSPTCFDSGLDVHCNMFYVPCHSCGSSNTATLSSWGFLTFYLRLMWENHKYTKLISLKILEISARSPNNEHFFSRVMLQGADSNA